MGRPQDSWPRSSLKNKNKNKNRMGSREEELKKAGWVRRFTAEEPRLSEAVEFYRALGFEVHLEPAAPEELGGEERCGECFKVACACDRYKTIYTRKRQDQ